MKTVIIFLAYVKLSYVQITLKASYQYVVLNSFLKIGQLPKKKMAVVYCSLNVKRRSDIEHFKYRNFMDRNFPAKYQAIFYL